MNSIILILICVLLYQLKRNQAVYTIRKNWINTYQFDRLKKYTYEYMFDPNMQNWFGFRYTKDTHYT